jgi:carbonic anhydrase
MDRLRKAGAVLSFFLILILLNGMLFLGAVAAQDDEEEHEEDGHHWSYEGEEGPEHWGEMSEDFALCGEGMEQSPIDIAMAEETELVDLEFNYADTEVNILNNGHTIQVNYDEGSTAMIEGVEYNLLQFHFHTPSEHTIDGEPAALEMHLVHADADSNLAVVGVMLMVGEEDNEALAALWDVLPAEEMEAMDAGMAVNVMDLMPEDHTYFHYYGSLTTPPCSEGVNWNVLTTPVMVSEAQLEAFEGIFEMNARPVQPINDRELLVDDGADM